MGGKGPTRSGQAAPRRTVQRRAERRRAPRLLRSLVQLAQPLEPLLLGLRLDLALHGLAGGRIEGDLTRDVDGSGVDDGLGVGTDRGGRRLGPDLAALAHAQQTFEGSIKRSSRTRSR